MPFTFSHPAIVLPLTANRLKLSATGLIVGSMTPDFEYFIRMRVLSHYSHKWPGLFWFDLPLGLILCFIYHIIVRNSLIINSPAFIQQRLAKFKSFNWRWYFQVNWVTVCISILIGAFSHLLWDSFSHETGYFVERLPALRETIDLNVITLPEFKVNQYVSTLIGGIIIAISFFAIKRDRSVTASFGYKYWMIVSVITLAVVLLRFIFGLQLGDYGDLIATIISAGLIALILAPLILSTRRI